MAERMEADLWRLDIPLVGNPLKNLNSYLITGERNLLIDTGFRQVPCREAMDRQLRQIGVDMDRTDIFLTHLHSDHAGLAPELVRPGCRIYISGVDLPGLEDAMSPRRWQRLYRDYEHNGFPPEETATLWHGNPAQNAGASRWDPSLYTPLADGAELIYGSHHLRCILTPGHTPGHLCLYEPERRWLFCGDHVLFHITPNICRWSGVADSLGDYLESLARIKTLPVARLLRRYPVYLTAGAYHASDVPILVYKKGQTDLLAALMPGFMPPSGPTENRIGRSAPLFFWKSGACLAFSLALVGVSVWQLPGVTGLLILPCLLSAAALLVAAEGYRLEGAGRTPGRVLTVQYSRLFTRHWVCVFTPDVNFTLFASPFAQAVGRCNLTVSLPGGGRLRARSVNRYRAAHLPLDP